MAIRPQNRRRNIFINPRFQGGVALAFAAVVFAGGALFAWLLYRDVRAALWEASLRAHFRIRTPYEIVGESVLRHLAGMFAVVLAGSAGVFLLVVRRIRRGIGAVVASLGRSAQGDLSTPTAASGLEEIEIFGGQVDEVRRSVLSQVEGIRAGVEALRAGALPEEEFRRGWDELRRRIGGLAP